MSKADFRVVTGSEVAADDLDRFMRSCFSEEKCDFLHDHGHWRHREDKNRLAVVNGDGQVVGYCAAIPAPVWLYDREVQGLFWVDLYVPPTWRGRGIQSLTDEVVRRMGDLGIGFCNKAVVPIHRKHGWGIREVCQVRMLPLIPHKVFRVHITDGRKGVLMRSGARLAAPVAWFWRHWLKRYQPLSARIVGNPDPRTLAQIFRRHRQGWLTTNRTPEYLRWRYLDSPHRSQYTFLVGGTSSPSSLVAISRTFARHGVKVTRILDIFGNLKDQEGLLDLLRLIAREAARNEASQVTSMASNSVLVSALRAVGFFFSVDARFRWFSRDPDVMRIAGESQCHWVLGDSDNDTVD